MPGLKKWFNDLSLYQKIVFIVSFAMLSIYVFFFFQLHFLSGQYEEELYQVNAQALSHVSASITGSMQAVETLSQNIIGDGAIQDNLYEMNNNPVSNKVALYKRDIYKALYPYLFQNKYIKSINIIQDRDTNICMGNSDDLKQFDRAGLERETAAAQGRLIWGQASHPGSDVVSARQIRQLKYVNLSRLADLYLVLDMEQLIGDALDGAGYAQNQQNFILMASGRRIYPAVSDYAGAAEGVSAQIRARGQSYSITDINGKKMFVIAGSIPYSGWEYLYFRDYNSIFRHIRDTGTRGFVLSLLFLVMCLLLVQFIFARILKHMDRLVEKIKLFGKEGSIDQAEVKYDYQTRQDEIGQLHRSFDEMTKSVNMLRDENYDKQILLRDAKIKMLQQQVNPHFLYNTLDTINWMAQKYGAEDISRMVRSLGRLFRAAVTGDGDVIPLQEELAVLNDYISIQKVRFADRLDFKLEIPETISHIYVPKLCIQPLVENALKHALEYSDQMCIIRVGIGEEQEHYVINVSNTGSRFEEDLLWKIEHRQIIPQGSGIGLPNIDARMKLLYGENYGLSFYNQDGMAVVMLRIPKVNKPFSKKGE